MRDMGIYDEVNSAMRFIVRRYDSVPTVDQNNGHDLRDADPGDPQRYTDISGGDAGGDVKRRPNGDCFADDNANKLDEQSRTAGLSLDTLTDVTDAATELEIDNVVNRGRVYAKRQRRRLVCKDGDVNIVKSHMSNQRRKFVVDIFTTLLELKWRYIILIFALGFVLSWLSFAVIWYIVMKAHGDTEALNDDPDYVMCIANVYDFSTALLFSIETQHTIGYGARMVNSKCVENIPLLMMQSCLGVFIQALLAGLIFAKLSRPKKRANTIMFSKNAVICKRDGELCLLFRVGDMRKCHIIGATVRAVMVRNRLTAEGELIPLCSVPLKVEAETMIPDDNFVFLAWPVTVVHRITRDSPLWDVSAEQLIQEKFEIVVVLEGTIESTGMTAQLRTSYLPTEILWGHHLDPLVTYQKTDGQYKINYSQFHETSPIKMSELSAKELEEKDKQNDRNNCNSNDPEHPEYPVNFTAPTYGVRQKRSWSLRRGSLRGSLRRANSKQKGKPAASPTQNGMAKFITTPSTSSLYNSNQGTCTSLHSVSESQDDGERRQKGAGPQRPGSVSGAEQYLKRSKSSPEHCVNIDMRDIRSADTSDTEVF